MQPLLTEDARVRTNRGGCLFLLAMSVSLALAAWSIHAYLTPPEIAYTERIEVDSLLSHRMPISLNISFPKLSCADVEFVVLDVTGEAQLDVSSDIVKQRLSPDGQFLTSDALKGHLNRDKMELQEKSKVYLNRAADYCGSCYGAELNQDDCCKTCHDVKVRYSQRNWDAVKVSREAEQCLWEMDHPEIAVQPNEGCNVHGELHVNKVAGNVHVALGTTRKIGNQVLHTFVQDQLGQFDTSHEIVKLHFGEQDPVNPDKAATILDNTHKYVDRQRGQTAAIQYYIHLIPTKTDEKITYRLTMREKYVPVLDPEDSLQITHETQGKHSNQHASKSLSQFFTLPGVYFMYDFSPFVVVREPNQIPLIDLITDLLTVAGGTLVLVRLLDSALHLAGL